MQAHSGKKSVICSDKVSYRFCVVKTETLLACEDHLYSAGSAL